MAVIHCPNFSAEHRYVADHVARMPLLVQYAGEIREMRLWRRSLETGGQMRPSKKGIQHCFPFGLVSQTGETSQDHAAQPNHPTLTNVPHDAHLEHPSKLFSA